jgi:hypothetical protein
MRHGCKSICKKEHYRTYEFIISEDVFFTGTPQTTNKNTVSKLYIVFIGRFLERVLNLYSEITCVRSDIMNSLIIVGHQISSFSLISTNVDCRGKLGKKTQAKRCELMKNLETTGFVSYYKDTIIFHEGMYLITID